MIVIAAPESIVVDVTRDVVVDGTLTTSWTVATSSLTRDSQLLAMRAAQAANTAARVGIRIG